ncbi:MAG: VWA domain-containing protein [Hydrogenovibrio sp.]
METTQLHFLRPEWLLTLLPAAWLIWRLWHLSGRQGGWNQWISEPFKPILLGRESEQNRLPWPVLGLAVLWFLAIIAVSGPSWQKVEVPAEKSRQGTVILFDLSLSMLSDDLKPNRLTRARYQVINLLKAHPELSIGMVVYAGSAHTLAPISEDNQTLLALTPTLNPLIMPSFGANAVAGFEQALALFDGARVTQKHLLWITDDVERHELNPLTQLVKQHGLQLSLLVVGTANGGPIQVPDYGLIKDGDGKVVMAKVPMQRFQRLAQQTDARMANLGMQAVDMEALLPSALMGQATDPAEAETQPEPDKTLSGWLDAGVYLLWLLPLAALAFRRGWAFSWLGVGVIGGLLSSGLVPSGQAWAETASGVKTDDNTSVTLLDVFKSPDQQGYEKWLKQDYRTALDRFEDPMWRGASLYRQGKYAEAAQQFRLKDTAEARYNEGNALAKSGDLEGAKTQYEAALAEKPDFQDAHENLALIEDLLQQQKNAESQQGDSDGDNPAESKQPNQDDAAEKPPSESDKNQSENGSEGEADGQEANSSESNGQNGESGDGKSQGGSQPSSAEQGNAQSNNDLDAPYEPNPSDLPEATPDLGKNGQAAEPEANNADAAENHQGRETEQSPEDASAQGGQGLSEAEANGQGKSLSAQQNEEEQARQNWLKQIPDEPEIFLKRKFEYQYRRQDSRDERPETDKNW